MCTKANLGLWDLQHFHCVFMEAPNCLETPKNVSFSMTEVLSLNIRYITAVMFFRILAMQYVAKLQKKVLQSFLLDSQSSVQKFLSWIFTFSHFHFFSKYIATFIYHAFYCIAIAQVRIIQEDRRERDEKRNKYLCRGLVITVSEWERCSERKAGTVGRGEGRGGGRIRISLLLVNILAAYDLVNDPVENVKN